jgi:hypothetical protein
MKIAQLVQALDEAGPRSSAQQASMQAAASGQPRTSVSSTVPQAPATSTGQQSAQAPAHPDPTLSQPLPAADPNAPGIGTRIGQGIGKLAKGIGAVAGVPQGIGRAIKKGYQAGVSTIGGPGAQQPGSSAAAAPSDGGAELDQLKATLQAMDQRLRRAGFESKER